MATKKVYIIHGWGGYPEEGCFPWLKNELGKRGYDIFIPSMPEPEKPKIKEWVAYISQIIEKPDKNTYLFGHSIGAQAILRYLESLNKDVKIGGAVFLAGWVHLTDEAYETKEDEKIAEPWLNTPLNWDKIRSHTNNFIAIFSDNDKLVPLSDKKIFKDKLGAKIIIENKKGHFSGSDNIKKLPSALKSFLEIAK
ncbi:MAG: alpha/beta hydrolase [Patescibacteria group bacterium]